MKGLILYEMYKLKAAYMKNLILVGVLYAVFILTMRTEFLAYMLMWMMIFYAVGGMALDEGWTRFARALPVRPGQLSGAKFASAGIMLLLGMAYALLMGGALCAIDGRAFGDFAFAVLMVALLAILLTAIMLPCALKWGVERARNTLLLAFAALFGGGVLLGMNADLSGISRWLDGHLALSMAILAAAAAIACGAGWFAMAKVYEGKES